MTKANTKQQERNDTFPLLRRLVQYMIGQDNRPQFLIGTLLRVVSVLGMVAVPYITGQAMNVISSSNGAVDELIQWVLLGVFASLVFVGASFFSDRIFANLATTGLYKLQAHLFSHIQSLSLTFFDRTPVGELLSRVTNDAEVVALFFEQGVGPLVRAFIQVTVVTIVMAILNWQLTLWAMLVVPVLLFGMWMITRVATPAFEKLQTELGEASGFQEETLSGYKVLISNRRQDWASDANEQLVGQVFDTGQNAFFTSLLQIPLTISLIYVQTVVVLTVGSIMVINGNLTIGMVMAFIGFSAQLSSPLADISQMVTNALNAVAGARRLFSIIDEKPVIVDAPDAKDYEFKGGRIEFEDVDFSYVPGRKILKHNTFVASAGESIGICGPTGAGKSTIMNILTRYYEIDSGRIMIDGQDLKELTQVSLRKQIGMVLQEAFLFTDTVMNNLKYAREGATDEECIEAAKQANAHDFIMQLSNGYDTMLTERGSNLSQGQRQMITIARAMVAQPKIMILDEATSNVDTRTEKLIQEGLLKLMEGKTSFSIAHRLATIADSSRIMVLNGGEIVELDSHKSLMAKQNFYYALYMSQFKGKAPGGKDATDVDFVST